MNIGCISPYLDALGGGERYLLSIASYLARHHQVTLFWDDHTPVEKARKRLNIDLSSVRVLPNVWKPGSPLGPRLFRSVGFDLLVFLSDGSVPMTLARRNIMHFQRPFRGVGGRSFLNRIKMSRFGLVLVNSSYTKTWIDREFGITSHILYPPVPPISGTCPKERILLNVGRFSSDSIGNKKQVELVRTFARLIDRLPGYRLVLAGGCLDHDRSYLTAVEQASRGLPVTIRSNIGYAELSDWYRRSSMYWHATGYGVDADAHPEANEHFGISPVEAMSAGSVPLVFDGGGLREIIRHGTDGFLWQQPEDLARETVRLAHDDSLRIRMSGAAIDRARDFSPEVFTDRLVELIRDRLGVEV